MMNARKLRLESLEERTLLAVMAGGIEQAAIIAPTGEQTWIVNTLEDSWNWTADDDIVSLREAIVRSADGDTIIFDESLASGTIVLFDGLEISKGITVDADGVGGITIDGKQKWTCFAISADQTETPVELIGLTITNGKFDHGGGIDFFGGTLNLTNCTITKNYANDNGGGIYQTGTGTTLTITDCTISDNNAANGGGIYNDGGTLTVTNSTISENTAYTGGGIYVYHGTLTFTNTIVSENSAGDSGGIFSIDDSTLTLTNSTVSKNTARDAAGGIYNDNSTLTLMNSFVLGNTVVSGSGGGIWNVNNSTLTLVDSTISGNTAGDSGGGIYNIDGCMLMITRSTISENIAKYDTGGGIFNCYSSIVTLTDSTVSGNTANNGGGIYNFNNSTLNLTDSTVSGNTANTQGGGIYGYDGTLTLSNSTITGNTSRHGGGIYNNIASTLTLTNSTVSENYAYDSGGGIFNSSSTLTLTNSIISWNAAYIDGGGIYSYDSSLTVTDSTISGNSANLGGGVNNYYSTLTLTNSTVSGNTAREAGGINNNSSTLTLTSSTVAMNMANYGGGIYDNGTIDLYNSIIAQNTSLCPGNDIYKINIGAINAYNTLSSFTDWTKSENCIVYDPSIPLFTDALHGDFTPAEHSQAVNTGNNDYVETETDLAGNPRIYGATVDIGAYEYQGTPSPVPTEQLAVPTIITGNRGIYVSYGANRHQITWTAVENASGYELAYTTDGINWSSAWVGGTSGTVGNLTYGSDVTYRVRALGEGPYIYSDWSETKTFRVCPMDVNNDGDISGTDRLLLSSAWLKFFTDEGYQFCADIDGNGDISNADRLYLSKNWLANIDADNLVYPGPLAAAIANTVFTEYASADLADDLDIF